MQPIQFVLVEDNSFCLFIIAVSIPIAVAVFVGFNRKVWETGKSWPFLSEQEQGQSYRAHHQHSQQRHQQQQKQMLQQKTLGESISSDEGEGNLTREHVEPIALRQWKKGAVVGCLPSG